MQKIPKDKEYLFCYCYECIQFSSCLQAGKIHEDSEANECFEPLIKEDNNG